MTLLMINDEANNYYYFAIKILSELDSLGWLRGKKEAIINNNNNNNLFKLFFKLVFICKQKNLHFSSTLTAILSIVGHITRDACISLYLFKSSGFSHYLLRITIKIFLNVYFEANSELIMDLFFQIQNLQLSIFDMDGQEFLTSLDYVFYVFFCNIIKVAFWYCFIILLRLVFLCYILDLCLFHMHMILSNQLIAFYYYHLNAKQSC